MDLSMNFYSKKRIVIDKNEENNHDETDFFE